MKIVHNILAFIALSFVTGCMNAYVRWPTTDRQIESVYQSTGEMAGITIIASFPQMMSDNGSPDGFIPENLISIPFLGLPCFMDTVLEGIVDTVCLPFDIPISMCRKQ